MAISGCLVSEEPLITADNADHPFESVTYFHQVASQDGGGSFSMDKWSRNGSGYTVERVEGGQRSESNVMLSKISGTSLFVAMIHEEGLGVYVLLEKVGDDLKIHYTGANLVLAHQKAYPDSAAYKQGDIEIVSDTEVRFRRLDTLKLLLPDLLRKGFVSTVSYKATPPAAAESAIALAARRAKAEKAEQANRPSPTPPAPSAPPTPSPQGDAEQGLTVGQVAAGLGVLAGAALLAMMLDDSSSQADSAASSQASQAPACGQDFNVYPAKMPCGSRWRPMGSWPKAFWCYTDFNFKTDDFNGTTYCTDGGGTWARMGFLDRCKGIEGWCE